MVSRAILFLLRAAVRVLEAILSFTPLDARWGISVRARTRLFDDGRPALWLHAASLGELNGALRLVRAVDEALGESPLGMNLVLSLQTVAAYERARTEGPGEPPLRHFRIEPALLPFENPRRLAKLWKRNRVVLAVAYESELWPAVCQAARSSRVPLIWWSARLGPRAARRWERWAPGLFRAMARSCSAIRAAEVDDSARLARLTGRWARVCGDYKRLVGVAPEALRAERGCPLCALSLHLEELPVLLELLRAEGAPRRWILQMRRSSELRAARRLCRGAGWRVIPWREGLVPADGEVALVESFGKTRAVALSCAAALVGGSLVPGPGVHNALEPLECGNLILTGPYWYLRSSEIRRLDERNLRREIAAGDARWPECVPPPAESVLAAVDALSANQRAQAKRAALALCRFMGKKEQA